MEGKILMNREMKAPAGIERGIKGIADVDVGL